MKMGVSQSWSVHAGQENNLSLHPSIETKPGRAAHNHSVDLVVLKFSSSIYNFEIACNLVLK
jgi:hypothetical protein